MKTSHRLIFFLNAFSTGLVAAVLSLIYLAHGADIQSLIHIHQHLCSQHDPA